MIYVNLQYYVQLCEQVGVSIEQVSIVVVILCDLYDEFCVCYGFMLFVDVFKVVVNIQFSDWSWEFVDGDMVVFIFLVVGG